MSLHAMKCACPRCEASAAVAAEEAAERLSQLAGGKVWLAGNTEREYRPRAGLCLRGAVRELARLCGFEHADGRCYFTGPKILYLLSMESRTLPAAER